MSLKSTMNASLATLNAADEATKMILVKDYQHIVFTLIASGSANATVKVYHSTSNSWVRPDLTSVASATNIYSTVEVINLSDGSTVDWGTGIAYAGSSDGIKQIGVNVNATNWVGIKMTARSAGQVAIELDTYDNS